MPKVVHDFAILAPVPVEHLVSGEPIAKTTGFVAYGTGKWELLQEIDVRRAGDPIPVLIYPSYDDSPTGANCMVSWFGWYVGHVHSKGGAHPAGMAHRPPSTEKYPMDNLGHWVAFWHVEGLRKLPPEKHTPISKIGTVKGGWRKNAPPRGPELVQLPEHLSYES